jgi:hypothetical protein
MNMQSDIPLHHDGSNFHRTCVFGSLLSVGITELFFILFNWHITAGEQLTERIQVVCWAFVIAGDLIVASALLFAHSVFKTNLQQFKRIQDTYDLPLVLDELYMLVALIGVTMLSVLSHLLDITVFDDSFETVVMLYESVVVIVLSCYAYWHFDILKQTEFSAQKAMEYLKTTESECEANIKLTIKDIEPKRKSKSVTWANPISSTSV